MASNFGGLYEMLPARQWFDRSPFDGAYFDPRYLGLASMHEESRGYLDG